jgi:plastocyanin
MWVASAVHPTHAVYSGTNLDTHCPDIEQNAFDQCEDDEEYSFTFDKAGDWRYHDHLNEGYFGTITVTP